MLHILYCIDTPWKYCSKQMLYKLIKVAVSQDSILLLNRSYSRYKSPLLVDLHYCYYVALLYVFNWNKCPAACVHKTCCFTECLPLAIAKFACVWHPLVRHTIADWQQQDREGMRVTLQMKVWWESNIKAWFPFMYSQKLNCAASLFPKQNYNVLSPNSYPHMSVRDLYISRIGLSILLQPNMWNDRHMNVGIGTEAAQFLSLGIHKFDFRYSVLAADQQSCILGSKLQADWPYNSGGHQWSGNSRIDSQHQIGQWPKIKPIYRSIISRIVFFDRLSILSVKRKLLIGTGCGITFSGIDRYSIILIDGRFTNGIWNLKYTHFFFRIAVDS